jgi:hypothetical protein
LKGFELAQIFGGFTLEIPCRRTLLTTKDLARLSRNQTGKDIGYHEGTKVTKFTKKSSYGALVAPFRSMVRKAHYAKKICANGENFQLVRRGLRIILL